MRNEPSESSAEEEEKQPKKTHLWRDLLSSKKVKKSQERLEIKLQKYIDAWVEPEDVNIATIHMFPKSYRNAWIQAFIRYNTSSPSSAAVERVFSMRSNIMRPRRNRLTSLNFERLLFLKGNTKLLDI